MDRNIRDVLQQTHRDLITVEPTASVREAVRLMNARHIGSILVVQSGRLVGIFTERDVLQRVVELHRDPDTTRVVEVMTEKPATVKGDQTVRTTLRLMTEKKVRHLPVIEGSKLVGIVSIGDLVWWITRDLRHEVNDLHEYIHGPVSQPTL